MCLMKRVFSSLRSWRLGDWEKYLKGGEGERKRETAPLDKFDSPNTLIDRFKIDKIYGQSAQLEIAVRVRRDTEKIEN